MKPNKHLFFTTLMLAALTASAWAQTQTASNVAPANPASGAAAAPASPPPVTAADVQNLKDALAAQQLQIQKLTEQLQRQQALLEPQQGAINAAEKTPANPPKQVASLGIEGGSAINPVPTNPVQQDAAAPSKAPNPEDAPQTFDKQMESTTTIHFRGINITPGGYAEGAFIHRSRALAADIATPYNSVTMPGASQSQIPEFFGTGRQSKISAFVDGRVGSVDLSSYVSADFLSAGVTSNSNQTNSYTLRLTQ